MIQIFRTFTDGRLPQVVSIEDPFPNTAHLDGAVDSWLKWIEGLGYPSTATEITENLGMGLEVYFGFTVKIASQYLVADATEDETRNANRLVTVARAIVGALDGELATGTPMPAPPQPIVAAPVAAVPKTRSQRLA